MNQIQKRSRYDEESDRIRAIVAQHEMPDFVTGFDVELGEFDGDPAMWVIFHIQAEPSDEGLDDHLAKRRSLREAVQTDLLDASDRYPFFRFKSK